MPDTHSHSDTPPPPVSHTPGKINRHDGHNESTAAWLFDESGNVIFTANHFNSKELATANADRVEKVWNAMYRIEDPEKFKRAYWEMLSTLRTQAKVGFVLGDAIAKAVAAAEAAIPPQPQKT